MVYILIDSNIGIPTRRVSRRFDKVRIMAEICAEVPEDLHLRILGTKGPSEGPILMLYQAMTQSFRAVVLWCVSVS